MKTSYAHYGQDLLADYILRKRKATGARGYVGRYIDVGCCYPVVSSNTYYFYKLGWKGVCVDANPDMQEEFVKTRPNDVYVSSGVGREDGSMQFFRYSNPQWNSFDKERAAEKADALVSTIDVQIRRLSDIVADAVGLEHRFDLMSIDTEGFELDVLQSFDISAFRPSLIIIESIRAVAKASRDPAIDYLTRADYRLVAHTGHDAFLLDRRRT